MSAAATTYTFDLFGNPEPVVNFDFRPPPEETFVTADLGELIAAGKTFGAIYVDPPWRFETYSEKGKDHSSPERHYACMSRDGIKALPVRQLAARDCALCLWTTGPMLPAALEVIAAWGFQYKTMGFVWVKTTPSAKFIKFDGDSDGLHCGMGFWTRSNAEFCLLGSRGKRRRKSAGVRQVVLAPVREHSRKPEEVSERIECLVEGPFLELFARRSRQGWTVWGDEVDLFQQQEGDQ